MIDFLLDSIKIENKACMNYSNSQLICKACVNSCPTDAISLTDQIPVIDYAKCINCSLCISVCPTLAIDHAQQPYHKISKQIEEFPEAKITCNQMEKYQKGIKVPCYLYLDKSLLIQILEGKNEITFYNGKCKKCPISDYLSVEEHILNLKAELEELQVPLTINFESEPKQIDTDETVNGLTRRELFKKLSVKNLREVIVNKNETSSSSLPELSLSKRTGFKRKVFNKYFLKKEFNLLKKMLPEDQFLNIEVNDKCSGCNVCESVCPTGAIQWINRGEDSELTFALQDCIGCKKCSICPENAIIFNSLNLEDYITRTDSVVLDIFTSKTCEECGEEFRTKTDEKLCSVCSKKKNKDSKSFFAQFI